MQYTIETNFELNQIVYVIYNNRVVEARIIEINVVYMNFISKVTNIRVKYYLKLNDYTMSNIGYYEESNIFKTKKELINSL